MKPLNKEQLKEEIATIERLLQKKFIKYKSQTYLTKKEHIFICIALLVQLEQLQKKLQAL